MLTDDDIIFTLEEKFPEYTFDIVEEELFINGKKSSVCWPQIQGLDAPEDLMKELDEIVIECIFEQVKKAIQYLDEAKR